MTRAGMLYFVQVTNGGPIKVGYTRDRYARLQTLQGWCPYKIEPLFAIEGPKILETYTLEILKAHKVRGEWFHPHPFVLNFIESARVNGALLGCPDPTPSWESLRNGEEEAVGFFDNCIPAIWPDRAAMSMAIGQKTLLAWNGSFSDIAVCRIVIAARKAGFNLKTADLLRVQPKTPHMPTPRAPRKADALPVGRKSKPKADFLLITRSSPTDQERAAS